MNIVPTLLNNESPWWSREFCLLYFPLKFTGESKWILTLLGWWKGKLPQILQRSPNSLKRTQRFTVTDTIEESGCTGTRTLGVSMSWAWPCYRLSPLSHFIIYRKLFFITKISSHLRHITFNFFMSLVDISLIESVFFIRMLFILTNSNGIRSRKQVLFFGQKLVSKFPRAACTFHTPSCSMVWGRGVYSSRGLVRRREKVEAEGEVLPRPCLYHCWGGTCYESPEAAWGRVWDTKHLFTTMPLQPHPWMWGSCVTIS